MVKIDIVSGFLGAGKTTLIKKLLKDAFQEEQVVLIENEFGEIGIDGGFLKESGIEIREMNSGCICCSLVGDFGTSLREVIETYHPDRILIEPSGVGKLSDIIVAVQNVQADIPEMVLNSYTTVVDAKKCKMYMRNFGEFFNNQVECAGAIVMSRTDIADEAKVTETMEMLRTLNAKAAIITTPIDQLDGKKLLEVKLPWGDKLGNAVFQNCDSLTKIEFDDRYEQIPDSFLQSSGSNMIVDLPANLKTLMHYSFDTANVKSIDFFGDLLYYVFRTSSSKGGYK